MSLADGFLDATWCSGTLGCVGAVAVLRVDGWKAYIGPVEGTNEAADIRSIAAHGAPLTESQARGFFPQFSDKEYAL